ncbi:MAG: helix-turn-helix domain-containing protein [Chloroflexota bacterium]
MSYRIRAVLEARRAWNRTAQELAAELLHARRALGARQKDVAAAIGISGAEVSRRERGRVGRVPGERLAAHAAAVGLRLSVKLYPTGGGIRDVGQARYVARLVTRLSDLQAQIRAAQLKARDIRATRLVLAVAGSHANRRALASARPALVASFEMDSRRIWEDLAAGRDAGRDAILVL